MSCFQCGGKWMATETRLEAGLQYGMLVGAHNVYLCLCLPIIIWNLIVNKAQPSIATMTVTVRPVNVILNVDKQKNNFKLNWN